MRWRFGKLPAIDPTGPVLASKGRVSSNRAESSVCWPRRSGPAPAMPQHKTQHPGHSDRCINHGVGTDEQQLQSFFGKGRGVVQHRVIAAIRPSPRTMMPACAMAPIKAFQHTNRCQTAGDHCAWRNLRRFHSASSCIAWSSPVSDGSDWSVEKLSQGQLVRPQASTRRATHSSASTTATTKTRMYN